jgi:hypothetical protein
MGFGQWLGRDLFGHWGVVYNAVYGGLSALMPVDYRWPLAALLVVLGLAIFLFERILKMLFGGRLLPLLGAAYFGISVLLIRSLEWLATGLQTIPTLACDLLCLWAFMRYQRRPSPRWVALSAGAMALGLLFYEKSAFMPLYLLVVWALFLEAESRPRTLAAGLWRRRGLWLSYLAVLAAYGIARTALGATSVASAGLPTIGQWAQMYWLMWAKSLVPAAFGLALPTPHVNSLQLAIGIALQVCVVGSVAFSVRRRPQTWRVWVGLAICVLATGVVVGAARVRASGPEIATDQRYLVDFAWLVPLLVCLGFASRTRHARRAAERAATWTRGRLLASAAALGVAAYLGASIATAADWQDGWGGVAARGWEANVQQGVSALTDRDVRPVVADAPAPSVLTDPQSHATVAAVLPEFAPAAQVDGALVGPLFAVAPSGHLVPARPTRVLSSFDRIPSCGRRRTGDLAVTERLSGLAPRRAHSGYYALVAYRVPVQAEVPVFVDRGSGFPRYPTALIGLAPDAHSSLVWLGDTLPQRLRLEAPVGYVCVNRIAVVALSPPG